MSDEETPLLYNYGSANDIHSQFCLLVGVPPSNLRKGQKAPSPNPNTLYGRAVKRRNTQNGTYLFTATLSNTLLLTQVVLGAALTGLGASESSHILITVFGALNTVIAGLVAYLKSRGQPMRSKMFRDDLERVVDEIENSEIMWLGISRKVHGYDEIAIDDSVSVRSEVARLTRLYDKAVRSNTMNDPDMYLNTGGDGAGATLRARPPAGAPAPPAPAPAAPVGSSSADAGPGDTASALPPGAPAADPDASPATTPPKKKDSIKNDPKENPKNNKKDSGSTKSGEPSDAAEKGPPKEPAKDSADPAKTDSAQDLHGDDSKPDSNSGIAKDTEDLKHSEESKDTEDSKDAGVKVPGDEDEPVAKS